MGLEYRTQLALAREKTGEGSAVTILINVNNIDKELVDYVDETVNVLEPDESEEYET